jgi:hypothetical protein
MKRILTFLVVACIALSFVQAQEEEKPKYTYTFGGFINYSAFLDTYQSAVSREGEIYLYPLRENLDTLGNDLNESPELEMLSLMTRVFAKVKGPQLFGASTMAHIEGDFLGTDSKYVRQLRLRHAYVRMNWDAGSELTIGHTWHPMFISECFAFTPIWAVGIPFSTLNRSAQIKLGYSLTNELKIYAAAISNGYHRSAGTTEEMQAKAVIPDLQGQIKYTTDNFFVTLIAGYTELQPRSITAGKVKTEKTVSSFNSQLAFRITAEAFTINYAAIYGTNLSRFVMLGGYGRINDKDNYDYSSLKTFSTWTDIHTNGKWELGVFGGLTQNLGADKGYVPLAGRAQDMSQLLTVSPRVKVYEGKMSFALEYRFIAATYGTKFDENYKATETADPTVNNRIAFNMMYKF